MLRRTRRVRLFFFRYRYNGKVTTQWCTTVTEATKFKHELDREFAQDSSYASTGIRVTAIPTEKETLARWLTDHNVV